MARGKSKAELAAAEASAYDAAKPAFAKYCTPCHTTAGKRATAKALREIEMTSYPFIGARARSAGNEIRSSLGLDGTKPTMPLGKGGSVTGPDLKLIAAWGAAWKASGHAGNHPADPSDYEKDANP